MLALFARGSAQTLADTGYLALVAMLSIYIGAELVTGDLASFAIETSVASVVVIATRLAMQRWLPAIGIAIFLHGIYDALLGSYTGVADWYPPLCAGFDMVVGVGLVVFLKLKERPSTP